MCVRLRKLTTIWIKGGFLKHYPPCLFHIKDRLLIKTGCSRYPATKGTDCNRLKVVGLCGIYAWQELDARDRKDRVRCSTFYFL